MISRISTALRAKLPIGALCVLLTTFLLSAGCSSASTESGASGAAGSGGASGSAGTGGTANNNGDVCTNACLNVKSCTANGFTESWGNPPAELDTPACLAQCAKELKGEGYLAPYIVEQFFGDLASKPDDPTCSIAFSPVLIGWRPSMDRIDAAIAANQSYAAAQPDAIEHCVDLSYSCRDLPEQPRELFYLDCFLDNYRFTDSIRQQAETCDAKVQNPPSGCDDRFNCKFQNVTSSTPVENQMWFGDQPVLAWIANKNRNPF